MNAVAQIPRVSPVDQFVGEVLPPERRTSLFSGLPSHIKPAVFERNLVNAVMANPNLMKYDPRLVYREVSKAAGLGLLLDPQLGEAYILEAYNYKTKSTEPQLRVGYRGLNKLARQSGEIDQLYAHEVYSADYVECELGDQKKLIHKPILFSDRGEIVGYYAVVKYKNGETDFEPMSVKQVHDIRDRSDAWKAFAAGKIKSTPWSTDEEEMAKKTILRRLVKRVPQSPELQAAIRIEDQADVLGDVRAIPAQVAAPRLPPAAPRVAQVAHQQQDDATVYGGGETLDHDPETGEIDAGEQQETQREPEKARPVETKQEPKPAAKAAPKVAPKAEQQDQPAGEDTYDPAPILAKIKALFDGARDEDHLEDIRSKQALPLYERLKRSDQEAAILLYQEASARVAPADAETAEDDPQQQERSSAGNAIESDASAEDDTFPGDRPSKASAVAAKSPTDMTPAEYESYAKAYIAEATDGVALKKLWFGEAEVRETIGVEDSVRKALRSLFTDKANALRDAEA
ncbi:MAG: recombinase RecT [Beijerinckiaceae bacterium]|nr:recombinase RecT [Beijerinckiaceae bacterium]